jgi:hypothetical protein
LLTERTEKDADLLDIRHRQFLVGRERHVHGINGCASSGEVSNGGVNDFTHCWCDRLEI